MPLSEATIATMLSDALERDSYETVAARYGVNKADIWRAIHKSYVSPALRRAVDPPRKRTRIIKETTPAIKAWWDRHIVSDNELESMVGAYCRFWGVAPPEEEE